MDLIPLHCIVQPLQQHGLGVFNNHTTPALPRDGRDKVGLVYKGFSMFRIDSVYLAPTIISQIRVK